MAMKKRCIGLRNVKQDNAGKTLMAIGGVLLYCGMMTVLSARDWFTADELVEGLQKREAADTADSTK